MAESHPVFGEWVARLRRALDLTQQELADRVGCSVSALRKIESGERRPSREIADLLAMQLEVPAAQRADFMTLARREAPAHMLAEPAAYAGSMPPAPGILVPEPTPSSTIPIAPTPLVGREHEVHMIVNLLQDPVCRLVTLVGTGGIGKTRLALHAALQPVHGAGGATYYLDLGSLTSPELMAQTIAGAIGCQTPRDAQVRACLLNHVQSRPMLIVLDNLEHLLEGVDLLAEILLHGPGVKILATSREPLNLQGEWVFEVQGLPIPRNGGFEESSAVQLFLQSARRSRIGFAPDADEREAIVEICRLVEGLPLAIELAAGWVRMLSCREIAREIARDQHFLASTARDVPQRHRSIAAVFDQSWRLLGEVERRHLRRLSIFRGGFEREMAAQVAGASLADLASLMARSLVRRSGPHRYDMHELVRQYCRERLDEAGEAEAVAAIHATVMAELAAAARQELVGPRQTEWLDRVQSEINNVRAALDRCIATRATSTGLQIVSSLLGYWYQRDLQSEGKHWLVALLALEDASVARGEAPVDPLLRVEALATFGFLAYELGDFAEAGERLEEALVILDAQPNPNLLANVLVTLGEVYGSLGRYDDAGRVLERALALAQDDVYAQRRRALALMALADVIGLQGDNERAQYLYAASTAIYRDIGDINAVAYSLREWGWSALACSEYQLAESLVRESVELNQQTGSKIGMIACLVGMGAVYLERGAIDEAARLIAAAEAQMERHAVRLRPMDALGLARTLQTLSGDADAERLQRARAQVRGWSLEEAVASVLSAE